MAELNKDVLKNGFTEISNPNQMQPIFTDNKERSVIAEVTMQVKPLERAMRNALNRQGINANGMSYENVIVSFYNEFVKAPNEKAISVTYLSEHPLNNVKVSQFDAVDHQESVAVSQAIVTGVKNLATGIKNKAQLKKAKKMVAEGKANQLTPHYKYLLSQDNPAWQTPLTKTEAALASDVITVEKKLEEKSENDLSVSEGKMKKIIIIVVVLIVVAAGVYFFFIKK